MFANPLFFHVVANCSGRSKLRSKHRCVVGCSQVRQSMQYVVQVIRILVVCGVFVTRIVDTHFVAD